MNKFVTSALALAAAGSLSYADPGDNEWLELDSEINSLASALQPSSQDGMGWAFLLRASYNFSSSDIATFDANAGDFGNDVSGFGFQDLDLAFWGSVAEYGWRLSFDLDDNLNTYDSLISGGPESNVLQLEDAYGYWDCGGYVTATFGNFKPYSFRSASIDPENQLFINRTAIGSSMDFWDTGIQTHGTYEAFAYWFSVTNGLNSQTSDHYYSARVEWAFNAGAGAAEGAMGGNDEMNFTAGATYVKNDTAGTSQNEDDIIGLDVAGNFSSFGFFGEVAWFGDDSFRATSGDYGVGDVGNNGFPLLLEGDSTPFSVGGSFLVNPEWEVAARYENLDNNDFGDDNDIIAIAVVWYRSGNNAKWTAEWADYGGDNLDGSTFQVGLTLGATR
jgi:hypothetical protein